MSDMIPSIDRRISTLKEMKSRLENEGIQKSQAGKVITLSREFGCEGYPLAEALKEKLEALTTEKWTIFTEESIDSPPSDSVQSGNLSEDFGEQNQYLESIVAALSPSWKTEQEAYREVVKTIVGMARKGNSIIIGRGAAVITRDIPNCFHFRLIGGVEFRARSYADRHNLSVSQAEKIVQEKEKHRKEFLTRFLGTNFDLNIFHMIFNNEKVSTDRIVDTIIGYLYELD